MFSEPLFAYLIDRPLTKKLVDFFFLASLFTWIALVYVVATHYSSFEQLWVSKKPDVNALVLLDKSINEVMTTAMQQIGSDRAAVERFHDSIADVQGRHFVYESRSNEVVQPGVSAVSQLRQNVLLSMINSWAQEFVKDRCVYVTELKFSDQYFEYYRQSGVKSDIKCPVQGTNGSLIGFIVMEFTTRTLSVSELKTKETMTRDAASKIGAILSVGG